MAHTDRPAIAKVPAGWRPRTGWSSQAAQPVAQTRRRPEIASDSQVFVGLQFPNVEGIHLFGQPVMRTECLMPEAAEQPIPDNENPAVVLVEVFRVHAVVN